MRTPQLQRRQYSKEITLHMERKKTIQATQHRSSAKHMRYFLAFLLFFAAEHGLQAQQASLETADDFMQQVAEKYASFEDFQANVIITQNRKVNQGLLFSKVPNKLRINFSSPKDQVMVSDGKSFFIYIPQQNIVLKQSKNANTSTGTFTSRTGLDQLLKRYIASYVDKPTFVPLENRTPREYVMKIRMKWKSPSQNFRELLISIGRDFLIYRVEALTYNRETVQFDFSNIQVNTGIPDVRFNYDPPPTANVMEDFLF